MDVSFFSAKNGSETCSVNKINIHSSYNPEKEAERFTDSITLPFLPQYILVTEPALSYCAEPLRKKFPDIKLLAIRYCKDFSKTDNLWDKVFYNEQNDIENQLFNYLGEEGILRCLFLPWQASSKAYTNENDAVWNQIKNAVNKSSAVLSTRAYFAKRWIKNTIKFFTNLSKICCLPGENNSDNILIAASGRSLASSIPYIKKNQDNFFVIAVSSAIKPLLKNGIIPDLCISTDGGYWAKKHLEILLKPEYSDIPVALTCETNCPQKLFETNPILPLTYNDFIENTLFAAIKQNGYPVFRNGTVSGTAALFALSLTNGKVSFCGLDMAEAKGFQHTLPNALETNDEKSDFRLSTKCMRLTKAGLPSQSMALYRSWFSSQDDKFCSRVFRISHNFKFSNKLGHIQDLDWEDIEKQKKQKCTKKILKHKTLEKDKRKQTVRETIKRISSTDEWLKNVFPIDFLTYSRALKDRELLKEKLMNKNEEFLKELI